MVRSFVIMRLVQSKIYSIGVTFCFCSLFILTLYHYLNIKTCNPKQVNKSSYIEDILDMTRWKIKFETRNYNFSYSGVNKLDDLLMESGGTPVRSLIVSTWRSGSSFLGDLLNAIDSNFYHYEPLIDYKSKKIKSINKAVQRLENLLKCKYTNMQDHLEFTKRFIKYNTRLWQISKYDKKLHVDPHFTASFCKLFPFQSMKTVRLKLRYFEKILDDENLNVKVVLLVRDPRGVMESRRDLSFCSEPDCADPKSLCSDMIDNYEAANELVLKYPDRLKVLRFEDLVLNLNSRIHQLLKFLRLEPNESINEFILTHTNVNIGGAYSTFRVSHDVAFKWKAVSNFSAVEKIQDVCKEAMDLWGYQVADSASHMISKDFYPVIS